MNSFNNILKELQELSPVLAGVPRVNVYSTPEGYFDSLGGELLLKAHTSIAETFKEENGASVPEGYFDNLAGNILARIKGQNASVDLNIETASLSDLVAGIGNNNVFNVPSGYFEQLTGRILSKIKGEIVNHVSAETAAISELFAGIGNKNVYNVPAGYFEKLSENVLDARKNYIIEDVTSETTFISELVANIGSKNIYQVPLGYFENLSIAPFEKQAAPAKVISMKGRNIFRYAAAAVVTGVIALGSYFIMNNNGNGSSGKQAAVMAQAEQILKTNSFDENLESVSDEAIVNFLESKGQDVEAALVASLSDNKNLPSSTDYLFDDDALNDVLKTIDLNN